MKKTRQLVAGSGRREGMPGRVSFCRRFRPNRLRCVGLVLALGTQACASSFGAGVRHFDHGRYAEAIEELREAEGDAAAWHGSDRARYALYRGLVHLALGDRPSTLRWLGEAKRAVDANPTLLSDADLGRLASAWAHLPGR